MRHLVALHRGSVTATSEGVGKESEFIVRLPLLTEALEPVTVDTKAEVERGTVRILVVDDDVDAGESMAMVLRLWGYDVAFANDVASTMAQAKSSLPQVVLLDIAMPEASGYELAERLRLLPEMADATYVAISGFGQPEDVKRSERAGMARHLVKPVDPRELDGLLKSLLAAAGGGKSRSSQ